MLKDHEASESGGFCDRSGYLSFDMAQRGPSVQRMEIDIDEVLAIFVFHIARNLSTSVSSQGTLQQTTRQLEADGIDGLIVMELPIRVLLLGVERWWCC